MILGAKPCGKCFACGADIGNRHHLAQLCWTCVKKRELHGGRASTAVRAQIMSGKLDAPSAHACVDCGKPATEYDHRDYSRPLDVEPVCRGCNKKRGPALIPDTPLFEASLPHEAPEKKSPSDEGLSVLPPQ